MKLAAYRSRLLTNEQHSTMHDEICAAVLAAEPPNERAAMEWLTITSSYLHDVAPPSGGDLWSYLTDAKVASWIGASVLGGRSTHTLKTRRIVLERIIRVHRGGPSTIPNAAPRAVLPAPLTLATTVDLLAACQAEPSSAALRGFVAYIGAGIGHTKRALRFVATPDGLAVEMKEGDRHAIVSQLGTLSELAGQALRAEDWAELRATASALRIWLDPTVAIQTFRMLAVSESHLPLDETILRHRLGEPALSGIAEHLDVPDFITDPLLRSVLRGPGVTELGAVCTGDTTGTRSARPPRGGRIGGAAQMPRQISRAKARRLARQHAAQAAAASVVPDAVSSYIARYVPDEADAAWDTFAADVRSMLGRSGLKTVETTRKYAVALTSYLRWRNSEGLTTSCPQALTFVGIESFAARGLAHLSERSKRDYRSRLRTLAMKVNASADAPRIPGTGYNAVRAGYSTAEEAAIRRTALSQRRPEVRRRLSAVVGFCGGGGLNAKELRLLSRTHVVIADDGITVAISGDSPRTVVIRRTYETHVLRALDGVESEALVLDVGVEGKGENPVARIITQAEAHTDIPQIDTRRLRTTWITWLITQPIPLQVALAASGLRSPRTFSDMVELMPACDDFKSLRGGDAA